VTRPCRIGIQLPEVEWEATTDDMIAIARDAEAAGFDSIWLGDHLLYDLPGVGHRGPWEAWTMLAALAVATERVELGPLVASTSFHQPAMLAKKAATVDALSGGRLILGLGAGWNELEYRAFGFPYDNRVSRFEEAFTIIRTLLREGSIDHVGRYYRAESCVLSPMSPRPGGLPLLLGSIGPRMLRIGLPHVDAWNVWWSDYGNTPDGYREQSAAVDRVCEEVGRDPAEVARTAAVLVRLPGGTGRQMGDYGPQTVEPVEGTPGQIADGLAQMAEAGADHIQVVADPISHASMQHLAPVLAELDS